MTILNQTAIEGKKKSLAFLRKRFYFGVFLAILLIAINTIAGELSWYWIFKWFDNPMHVGGGIVAGYFGILFWHIHVWLRRRGDDGRMLSPGEVLKQSAVIWPALIITLIVGVAWEFLEHAYGLSGLDIAHRGDTVTDLVNDTTGGVIAIIIWELISVKYRIKNTTR